MNRLKIKIKIYIMYNYPFLLSFMITIKEFLGYSSLKQTKFEEKDYPKIISKKVQSGPFKGMIYDCENYWGNIYPKLLGSYESELHKIIESLIKINFDNIINVGSAEGYFSIGFALKSNVDEIIAVDPFRSSKKEINSLIRKNNITKKISFKFWTSSSRLSKWIKKNTLILMDCEGAEAGYLKNTSSTDFNKAHILCEIHDFSDHPNIGSDLIRRFNKTHRIEIIKQEKRQIHKYGAFGTLSENQMINLLDEHRPKSNYWIFFEPILVR